MGISDMQTVAIFLFISLIVFLVCRELVCWYWKQNEQVKLLNEQVKLLKELRDLLKDNKTNDSKETRQEKTLKEAAKPLASDKKKCSKCGRDYSKDLEKCPNCYGPLTYA